MGLLDGDLASAIYAGFAGQLLTGVIRQMQVAGSTALDDYGDPIDEVPVITAFEGFVENNVDAFRGRGDVPLTDVTVNIFAQSMPGVIPGKDDKARVDRAGVSTWYQLRAIMTDPAQALWVCAAFVTEAP